jgi:hypothetical protein
MDATVALDQMLDIGARNEDSQFEDDVLQQLHALEDLQIQQQLLHLEKQALIDTVLTDEIRQQIADIDLELAPREDALAGALARSTEAVKSAVAMYGKSVTGEHLQAVYVRGRESWDSRGLQGYAMAHPEVLVFQRVGEPSVSIRKR